MVFLPINLEHRLHRDAERLGDAYRQTNGRTVPTLLDGEDCLACDTDPISQLLLGHVVELAPVAPHVIPGIVTWRHSANVQLTIQNVNFTIHSDPL